jgi:hypothetical protein
MAVFIRVLDLLPHLQSLTILWISAESINATFNERSWARKVYPSIVSLALPDDLAPILHCFPNVQMLTMSNWWYSGKLFSAARDRCKAIHTVNNLAVSAEAIKCESIYGHISTQFSSRIQLSARRYRQCNTCRSGRIATGNGWVLGPLKST